LSLEAKPTSSFGFGIFINAFPSLLLANPFGGHTGEGDGLNVGLALANDEVVSA
jgi:hypothetical protein